MGSVSVAPTLSPHGRLTIVEGADAPPLDPELAQRLRSAFQRGSGHGLLQLGAAEAAAALPSVFSYWREFGAWYVTALCTHSDTDATPRKVRVPAPPATELDRLVLSAPPMAGAEYLTPEVLGTLWQELDAAFGIELAESKCGIQDFLKRRNPAWNLVGRVHFNLAENSKDRDAPFAFLATYTTRLSANAKAQHLPLGKAFGEYAGTANKDRLLSLLLPVQRASETCAWLKALVALWHRRKAGPTARPALPIARRGRKRTHRWGRTGTSTGQKGAGRKEGSRRRRPCRSLRIGHGCGREPRKAEAPEGASRQAGPGSARWKGKRPRTDRCRRAAEEGECLRGVPWLEKEMMPCCVPVGPEEQAVTVIRKKRRKHLPRLIPKRPGVFRAFQGIWRSISCTRAWSGRSPRSRMFLTTANTPLRNSARCRANDSARSHKCPAAMAPAKSPCRQ
jgi:hypothetical protein